MDLLGNDISIDDVKSVPDDCEFALESILAEFGDDGAPVFCPPPSQPEELSLPIIMDEDEGVLSAELGSADEPVSTPVHVPEPLMAENKDQEPEAPAPKAETEKQVSQEDKDVRIYRIGKTGAPFVSQSPSMPEQPEDEPEQPESPHDEPDDGEAGNEDEDGSDETKPPFVRSGEENPYAEVGLGAGSGPSWDPPAPEPPGHTFFDSLAAPFLSILALIAIRKKQRSGGGSATSEEDEEDMGPEMDAESAYKYYSGNVKSLRIRFRISAVLSIALIWISFGLPVAGLLKTSPTALALFCLILELTVVMLGLDIFTAGMMSLIRMKPSLWSLVAISCFTAALDAAVTAALGSSVTGLPFCGVAAISMTFALFGALQTCRGLRLSLRALSLSRDPYSVTSEAGVSEDGMTLLKSKRGTEGYLRRSEEPDLSENAYGTAAVFLLAAALILSVAAAAVSKEWNYFFRILAAITAPCAPFAAFLAFPLPYSIIARRVFMSGSAIAGWTGLRDIGSSKHLIITDCDIFPAGTLSIESVRILEGTWPEKVISCAGSVICASGSGLAPIFSELMRRNNCSIQRVEDFCCHEGGGLTAMINGEEILCGSASFMHLMGVRLPQKLASKSSVFVSLNGVLTGIFTVKYVPVTSVQDALAGLLHTRREPIFAIRDFNITPLMIRQKFRMPTDGFDFPTFAKRYEISAAESSPDSQISAIISREGLGALVEISDLGRKLYIAAKLSAILSMLCTFIGIALMFTLCLNGAFDSASAENLLTYMFLWLVPVIVLALGLGR
ncbi:MAG: hypothetical protein EOM54_08095 [Clostridia bacterium]|nr:hypothetical protein [Clostridia bacterium]